MQQLDLSNFQVYVIFSVYYKRMTLKIKNSVHNIVKVSKSEMLTVI